MTDDQAIAALDAAYKRLQASLGTDWQDDAYADLRRIVNDIHWKREAVRWDAFSRNYGAGK